MRIPDARAGAVLVALLTLLALGAFPERRATAAQSDSGSSVVADAVKARVAVEGSARVLVEVRLPAPFVPEGALATAAALLQRANLSFAQSQVLGRLQGQSYTLLHRFQTVPFMALEVDAGALSELMAAPFDVQRVVEDTLHEPSLFQSVPLIGADQAWSQGFDGTGAVVAILDTGIQTTHPFFAGKVVSEACYSSNKIGLSGQSSTLCPNGQTSQTGPGAGVNCSLGVSSQCFHGTHVAGIAAGNAAGVSYSGVARGAQILSIQVFSNFGSGKVLAWSSDIIAGLERVFALRGQLNFASVNLSLGSGQFSGACDGDPVKASIDNLLSAGIATVVASGNDDSTSQISSPACISTAVSVGSTEKNDVVSSFSNVASILSLLAPGGSILSAYPGNQYVYASGTSMAAPHVTGAFAVLKQAAPGASVSALLSALQQTGVPVTDTRPGGSVTKPRIRVGSALSLLGGQTSTLSVARAGTGAGTVTSSDGTINCGSTCAKSVTNGTQVTLTAAPGANSTFSSWAGCSSANGTTCNVTVSAATTVTATFIPTAAGLGVGLGGSGTGTVTSNDGVINCPGTCSSAYPTGTMVTLTATAGTGSTFKQWGNACASSGTNPSCGLTLNSTQLVTATFSKTFTDGSGPNSAILAGTVIKAVHVLELRTAIDNLRAARGMGGFGWTDLVLTVGSTPAKGIHVLDLRSALAPVCAAAPGKCTGYTDGTLSTGQTVIKAVHLNELRANVRALE